MSKDEEKAAEDLRLVWVDRLRVQRQRSLPPSRIEGINPGKLRQRT